MSFRSRQPAAVWRVCLWATLVTSMVRGEDAWPFAPDPPAQREEFRLKDDFSQPLTGIGCSWLMSSGHPRFLVLSGDLGTRHGQRFDLAVHSPAAEVDWPALPLFERVSPDGQWLATRVGPQLQLWNLADRTKTRLLPLDAETVDWFDFTPSNQLLVATSAAGAERLVGWSAPSDQPAFDMAAGIPLTRDSIAVSPGGRWVFAQIRRTSTTLWADLTTQRSIRQPLSAEAGVPPGAECVGAAFSPSGDELASLWFTAPRDLRQVVWDLKDGRVVVRQRYVWNFQTLRRPSLFHRSFTRPQLEWMPDGSGWLVSGLALIDRNSGLLVWRIEPGLESLAGVAPTLVDNDHVLAESAGHLKSVRIPWKSIDAAVARRDSDRAPRLIPKAHVRVQTNEAPGSSRFRTARDFAAGPLTDLIASHNMDPVLADASSAAVLLRCERSHSHGDEFTWTPPDANSATAPLTLRRAFAQWSLRLETQGGESLWSAKITGASGTFMLGADMPTQAAFDRLAEDDALRQLADAPLPHYISSDDPPLILPLVAEFPGAGTPSSRANSEPLPPTTSPKPTRRGAE